MYLYFIPMIVMCFLPFFVIVVVFVIHILDNNIKIHWSMSNCIKKNIYVGIYNIIKVGE